LLDEGAGKRRDRDDRRSKQHERDGPKTKYDAHGDPRRWGASGRNDTPYPIGSGDTSLAGIYQKQGLRGRCRKVRANLPFTRDETTPRACTRPEAVE
jgi:hypothetical protein